MKRSRIVLLVFIFAAAACHRNVRAAAPPPPAPPADVTPAALQTAETAFEAGDFARAARAYESLLQTQPKPKDMDRILFRFGVAQSLSGVTAREEASNDIFNQLIHDFPQSTYSPEAKMIIALRTEIVRLQTEEKAMQTKQETLQADQKSKDDKIKQLNDELDKLKKIDLDRRRTP